MVFKFQRFQLALGSVVEQPIDFGSTWNLGDCLGGDVFFLIKQVCLVFFLGGNCPPGKKTFNYSGPPKQWVQTRIRKQLANLP